MNLKKLLLIRHKLRAQPSWRDCTSTHRHYPPPPKRGDSSNAGDVNDAKDDDIIARQLREAAMQETDQN